MRESIVNNDPVWKFIRLIFLTAQKEGASAFSIFQDSNWYTINGKEVCDTVGPMPTVIQEKACEHLLELDTGAGYPIYQFVSDDFVHKFVWRVNRCDKGVRVEIGLPIATTEAEAEAFWDEEEKKDRYPY